MTTNDADQVPNFDHHDATYVADPYPVLRDLRETCPVAHSDAHGGFWLVTRYDDIRELAQDTSAFSSRYSAVPRDFGFGTEVVVPPLNLDPPDHTQFKALLASAFVPRNVEPLVEPIRMRVRALLAELLTQDTFDLSYDFARVVPTQVVCQLVGCPDELELFSSWVERGLERAATNIEDAREASMEMFGFIADLVAKRREEPVGDIISSMAEAEVDGAALSDSDIIFSTILLVLAGIDTTWSTIAATLLHLATHPEDQQRLRDNPGLLVTAREEFLRMFAPVSPGRSVCKDVEFRGQMMSEGDMIVVSFPSANRDSQAFEDSEVVKLDRQPNRHLAFGSGIHRCLGVNIARQELSIVLEEVMRMVPPFVLADPDIEWSLGQVRTPKHVRVRLADEADSASSTAPSPL